MVVHLRHRYYETPHVFWKILALFVMGLISVVHLCSSCLPREYLSPLGSLTKILIEDYPNLIACTFYVLWFSHVVEAYLAARLSSRLNLWTNNIAKWTIQTFIYGFFSLRLLMAYDRKMKRKL